MALCPIECAEDLIANPDGDCVLAIRKKTISRLSFFVCSTDLPDPMDDAAILALYNDGSIVLSSELANITLDDPTYEDVIVSACRVAQRVVVSRQMTFEDRVAITFSSPANAYHDYAFWNDKLTNQTKLNYIVHYCDGDSVIARGDTGTLLTASITAFLNWQKPATQGAGDIEFKSITVNFNGDPLALSNVPEFNLYTAGILG